MIFVFFIFCLARVAWTKPCSCSAPTETSRPVASSPATAGKRGIAYNVSQYGNAFRKACHKCTWAYNWAWTDQGLEDDIEYVPMVWGAKTFPELRRSPGLSSGAKYILGFNEPDGDDPDRDIQADMSVSEAVDGYVQYLSKYSGQALIGSPAVTSHNSTNEIGSSQAKPTGLDWLREFLELCRQKGVQVDFCAVHWYGGAHEAEAMFSFLQRAHEICSGKKIWLTEFHAQGPDSEVAAFLKKVLPILDRTEFVQRYAWWMAHVGNLLQSADKLSGYGSVYANE